MRKGEIMYTYIDKKGNSINLEGVNDRFTIAFCLTDFVSEEEIIKTIIESNFAYQDLVIEYKYVIIESEIHAKSHYHDELSTNFHIVGFQDFTEVNLYKFVRSMIKKMVYTIHKEGLQPIVGVDIIFNFLNPYSSIALAEIKNVEWVDKKFKEIEIINFSLENKFNVIDTIEKNRIYGGNQIILLPQIYVDNGNIEEDIPLESGDILRVMINPEEEEISDKQLVIIFRNPNLFEIF